MIEGACLNCGNLFVIEEDEWFFCSDKCRLKWSKDGKLFSGEYLPEKIQLPITPKFKRRGTA